MKANDPALSVPTTFDTRRQWKMDTFLSAWPAFLRPNESFLTCVHKSVARSGGAEITFAATGYKDKLDFVLVAEGKEIYFINTAGNTVEFGDGKKMFGRQKSKG